jgi:hypothetical protein
MKKLFFYFLIFIVMALAGCTEEKVITKNRDTSILPPDIEKSPVPETSTEASMQKEYVQSKTERIQFTMKEDVIFSFEVPKGFFVYDGSNSDLNMIRIYDTQRNYSLALHVTDPVPFQNVKDLYENEMFGGSEYRKVKISPWQEKGYEFNYFYDEEKLTWEQFAGEVGGRVNRAYIYPVGTKVLIVLELTLDLHDAYFSPTMKTFADSFEI